MEKEINLMKKLLILLLAGIWCLGLGNFAEAGPVNPSFEDAPALTGWTQSAGGVFEQAASAGVFTPTATVLPKAGSYFAVVSVVDTYWSADLSQAFVLNAGDQLSGWAYFEAGDFLPYDDNGAVRIYNQAGQQLAELWKKSVTDVNDYGHSADWEAWTPWIAPAAGTYTLQLYVENVYDAGYSSRAFFDDIQVVTPAAAAVVIHLTGSLLLLGSGLAGLAGMRLRKKA